MQFAAELPARDHHQSAGEIRPSYRPSIDGLRAIAILSVLLYHANSELLPGGFIGVDIFFVISGYLISALIFKELGKGRFSFVDFYARRVRRIFPALILTTCTTLIAGLFLLTSDEFVQLGRYAAASGLLVNVLEWRTIGYFDTEAALKPLLHLWSLGVEEQFYIVWPVAAVLLWRRGLSVVIVTALLASFAANIWGTLHSPNAAFYLPFGRAWEFLLGALLALSERAPKHSDGGLAFQNVQISLRHRSISLGDLAAGVAIVLLATGFAAIHSSYQFPGWWALLPAIGSFLLVWAGEAAWINKKILAHPAMVLLGLISYPLYLWHWPLLSLLRISHGGVVPPAQTTAALIAAIVLATLTWWLLERPLRQNRRARATIVTALLVAMVVTSIFGILGATQVIRSPRMAKEVVAQEMAPAKPAARPRWDCSRFMDKASPGYEGCRIWVDPNLEKTVVIWGDSFAGSWQAAAGSFAEKHGERLVQFMYYGCPPLLGARRAARDIGKECNSFDLAEDTVATITKLKPSHIILVGRWTSYLDHNFGIASYITAAIEGNPTEQTARAAFEKTMPETLRRLAHIANVIVVKGVPTLRSPTDAGLLRDPDGFEPTLEEYRADEAFANEVIDRAIGDVSGAVALDPADVMCDQIKCRAIHGGVRVYIDGDTSHLSDEGAMLFVPALEALRK